MMLMRLVRRERDKKMVTREGEKIDSSSERQPVRVRNLRQSHERQPPLWMGNYDSGKCLSEEEVQMALAVSINPLY